MAGVHNRRPPQHSAALEDGRPLTNFFQFPQKPVPTIHQNNRKRNVGEDDFGAEERYLRQQEEDEDLEYIREYREAEIQQIRQFNECHGRHYNRVPRRGGRAHRNGPSGNDAADASVQGDIADNTGQGIFDLMKDTLDISKRKCDSSNLAIYEVKDKILSAVNTHLVTIIEGFTGCGKTTQVPQFILDESVRENKYCKIVVTQPRRIAALSVANRVSYERNWTVGDIVGYQVGMERQYKEHTRLIYMTTGVLLQMLISKKSMREWSHIIIDEVHERDLDTDLLMLVIKRIMLKNKEASTKIILMSATMNALKFKNYFPSYGRVDPCTIEIPHKTVYPVEEHYLNNIHGIDLPPSFKVDFYEEPKIAPEIYEMAVNIIYSLDTLEKKERKYGSMKPDKNEPDNIEKDVERGAVLVFLPGLLEIESMYKGLSDFSATKAGPDGVDYCKWNPLPLHSTITAEEQQKVFLPVARGHRKIILATNIAESSITVTDIRYVIDFCLTKSLSCDPTTNYTCLRMEWASKNQCIQRKGRCGRVAPGHVFRMVPELFYKNLATEAFPEMMKSSLESVVLHAKMLDMGSPKALLALAIDPPKLSGIRRAVANLKEVGALTIDLVSAVNHTFDEFDGDLTYLGEVMARLPIDMRFGRLIMMGYVFGLLDEAIIIAAGLSTKSPFSYPYHRRLQAYLSKLFWSQHTFSDCFALINVYRTWVRKMEKMDFRRTQEENMWAKQYLVQLNVMREIYNLVAEIKRRLAMMNIISDETHVHRDITEEQGILLKMVIAGAFYPNYFVHSRPKKQEYDKEICKELIGRNPASTVVFQGFPAEQPGELYSSLILKHFEQVNASTGEVTMPYLEHEGSKILISFDLRGYKVGSLCHGIYRAVKMKQLRCNISFKIIERQKALDELEEAMRKLRLTSQDETIAPPQVTLPTITDRRSEVFITHVVLPTEIYVIYQDDLSRRDRLNEALFQRRKELYNLRFEQLKKGHLVFVEYEKTIHRGRIDMIHDEPKAKQVYVYLIDVGRLLWVKPGDIKFLQRRPVGDIVFETPALVIMCRLREVKAPVKHAGSWPCSTIEAVQEWSHSNCTLEIFSIVDSVIAGDFVAGGTSLRTQLWEKQLVESCAESRESFNNFELRRSGYLARQSPDVKKGMNEKQVTKKVPKSVVEAPKEEEGRGIMVTLRGPNSPLEMTFNALCRSSNAKQVNVDGASVNSVALDHDFLAPTSRLLIAGSVGIAHRSGNVMARDTTMLPAIPGLTGLLTLLFCPIMELRVDDTITQYTGALAGLGVDPRTREPVYADHDVEVIFDTKIDNEDLESINTIRMIMNFILRQNNDAELQNLRRRAIEETLRLLQRQRDEIEETWPPRSHEWNSLPTGIRLVTAGSCRDVDHTDVFQLHQAVSLDLNNPQTL